MDVQAWGAPLWNLLSTLATGLCRIEERAAARPRSGRRRREAKRARRDFLSLLYSLRYVIPCIYCRESYRRYIAQMPPERFVIPARSAIATAKGDAGGDDEDDSECEDETLGCGDALEWIWRVHNLVNRKLRRPEVLPLDKFRKRSRVWSSFSYPVQLWDLLMVLALNYPERDTEERDAKRAGYSVFLETLARCIGRDAWLRGVGIFLRPASTYPPDRSSDADSDARSSADGSTAATRRHHRGRRHRQRRAACGPTGCDDGLTAWPTRAAFVAWISERRERWARAHLDPDQVADMRRSREALLASVEAAAVAAAAKAAICRAAPRPPGHGYGTEAGVRATFRPGQARAAYGGNGDVGGPRSSPARLRRFREQVRSSDDRSAYVRTKARRP